MNARLRKVEPGLNMESAYEVTWGLHQGFVWSKRTLSYRGSQGWNRGIRLKDFHPLHWEYGKQLGERQGRADRRKDAVEKLIAEGGA